MPVRCKGLSEYRRNFKWRKSDQSELRSPTHEEKCRWAGLRSDQLGIVREPNFISKRRVPYYSTQILKSFEWNKDNDCETSSECSVPPLLELYSNHSKDDKNQEYIKTPDAPRVPEKILTNTAEPTVAISENKKIPPSKTPVHENGILACTEKDLGKIDNGLNRVLQRKAGMNILRSSSFPRSTEYQRQFIWRTPQKISPILAADQVIYSASKSIPPYKSAAIIPETEYERCFKPSPPVKELRESCNLLQKECHVFDPVESSPGEKNEKKESLSKMPEDPSKESKTEAEQKQQHKRKHKPLCLHRGFRKMNTEYRSKFLSPAQYIYKDGAWLRIRRDVPDQGSRNTLNYMWYMEVKELREKAEAYRQRIQGTHFSREHLNQILSDNNRLWDLSSASSAEEAISNNVRALDLAGVSEKQISLAPKMSPHPQLSGQLTKNNSEKWGLSDATTVADKRHIAWCEADNVEKLENLPLEEGEKKENKQESEGFEKGSDKDGNTNNQQEGNVSLVSSSSDRSDSASLSSRKPGRLPTPQLRVLGGAQRTHHDLTTPAIGGAVLVSPPKVESSSSVQVKKGSSEKQESREDTKRKSNRDEVEATVLTPSSAAGLKTQDPLPLRKDQWPGVRNASTTSCSEHTPIIPTLKPTKNFASSYWSPSRRIQGTLRDPEFQHNGNVTSPQRSWLQLPLQERNYNDEDDDRLSQLSARSAASSSLASQVLERAQRRKENFWGKM